MEKILCPFKITEKSSMFLITRQLKEQNFLKYSHENQIFMFNFIKKDAHVT